MRRVSWILFSLLLLSVSVVRPTVWTLAPCAVLLAAPFLSWLLLFAQRNHIRLEMDSPAVCSKGQAFPVVVRVKNGSKLPLGPCGVTVAVENAATGERARARLFPSPEARVELCSRYCGCLRLETASACLYDLFGVLPMKLNCAAEKRTLVMPDTVEAAVEPFEALSSRLDSAEYAQDRRGSDYSETFQVREYAPGDSLRQIHWKLSEKQGKLMVREGSYPVDQSLLVYLDRFEGDLRPEQADALLEAVVSVCQSLSEAGMPFRMGWAEEIPQAEDVSEQEQFPRAASLLLNLRPGKKGGFTQYLQTYGMPAGGRLLYFASELPAEWESLAGHTQAKAFLCGDHSSAGGDVVCFTAAGVSEALREVSW